MRRFLLASLLILTSSFALAGGKEVAIVNSPSTAADWIHFSGPSTAADWIHFSGPSVAATYVYITENCDESPIQLLDSAPTYADWVYVSGPSTAADWIHLSGPSVAADWYHITNKESMAEIKVCIPSKEMRTEQNIAILLYLLKKEY